MLQHSPAIYMSTTPAKEQHKHKTYLLHSLQTITSAENHHSCLEYWPCLQDTSSATASAKYHSYWLLKDKKSYTYFQSKMRHWEEDCVSFYVLHPVEEYFLTLTSVFSQTPQ